MVTKRKARMGRPPKGPQEKQVHRVGVNLTRAERAEFTTQAQAEGLSLSAFFVRCWRSYQGKG